MRRPRPWQQPLAWAQVPAPLTRTGEAERARAGNDVSERVRRVAAEQQAAMNAAEEAPPMSTVQIAQLKQTISEARPCRRHGAGIWCSIAHV